ncbi:hypothetical protein GCM10022225_12070 [Plantactinospora mayteni]|uniref:Uncharacterized protein n=1 Tax=Plantactinospora mayteni TaxID=566021 RepID=A0ABQ4EHD0_9ACTN|nr:hypothetical protein Pma05_06130 [Plantactinospora mayteni]
MLPPNAALRDNDRPRGIHLGVCPIIGKLLLCNLSATPLEHEESGSSEGGGEACEDAEDADSACKPPSADAFADGRLLDRATTRDDATCRDADRVYNQASAPAGRAGPPQLGGPAGTNHPPTERRSVTCARGVVAILMRSATPTDEELRRITGMD